MSNVDVQPEESEVPQSDEQDNNLNEGDAVDATGNAPTNDAREAEMLKTIKRLGREGGLGEDSLPKLGLAVYEYAREGVIDLTANKKAVHELYDVYVEARVDKRVHSQTADARSSQISKLKNFAELAANEDIDSDTLVDDMQRIYRDMPIKDKQSVYAAYVAVARHAKELKVQPTEDETTDLMRRKVKAAKSLADVVGHIADMLGDLMTGERKDGIQCQDQEIIDARGKLDEWLAKMTLAAELDAFKEQAAKFGVKLPKALK